MGLFPEREGGYASLYSTNNSREGFLYFRLGTFGPSLPIAATAAPASISDAATRIESTAAIKSAV